MPSSPSYYSSGGQQKHHYTYASPQNQHFHHPGAVSPPPANYPPLDDANGADFPPPPPPLSTTISNMQTATAGHSSFRPNPKLTANAVPRPYPGSPGGSNGLTSAQTLAATTPTNSNNYQHSFESTSIKSQNSSPPAVPQKPVNRNLEACVQDLHDKTFGQGGVVQLTTGGNGYPGQNYEGYTSRWVLKGMSLRTNTDHFNYPLQQIRDTQL